MKARWWKQGDKTAALNCNTDPTQQIIAYQCQGSNVGPMGTVRSGNQGVTGGVPFVFQERGREKRKDSRDLLTTTR